MPRTGYLILLVLIIIFVTHSVYLNFTQDDAFISYRYVKNFTSGNGLVFNSGERVEGYTNFLWIIVLSIFSGLGLNIILISKILGVVSGGISLFLLYKISSLFFPRKDRLFSLFPSFLLTACSAFAYWSISGLESAFFVMMILFSLYLYFTESRLWAVVCAVSILIRPEGALILGVLFLHKLLSERTWRRQAWYDLIISTSILLPFLVFKLFYYGDILPTPFYAKTGLSLAYMKSGLEYFWLFLRHYGLWGLVYLIPLLSYKNMESKEHLLVWLVYLYSLYVIMIGGDVLKVHRFFLPILPVLLLLLVIWLRRFGSRFKYQLYVHLSALIPVIALSALFFLVPLKWIRSTRAEERNLVRVMEQIARYGNSHFQSGFSIAATTIGSISYYLGLDNRVIDMLGLTDKYIAKHPERFEGITVSWKEKKYNSSYIMSRDPDFILFSTGFKPSAPAERALFVNSQFRQNYYVIPILIEDNFIPIFKRKGTYSKKNEIFQDTRFIDLFNEGIHLHIQRQDREAIEKLKQAILVGPDDFALLYELVGREYFLMRDYSNAEIYLKKAVELEECLVFSHAYLSNIYRNTGRGEESEAERKKVLLCDPNFVW